MTCPYFSRVERKPFCKIKGFFSPAQEKVSECHSDYLRCIDESFEEEKLHNKNDTELADLSSEIINFETFYVQLNFIGG